MQAVGAVLVVAACGLMGLTVACSYTAQAENVKGLITMLQILETEISYARSALPEALGADRQPTAWRGGELSQDGSRLPAQLSR